ncbi:MAG: 4'-phosphopantetheinyl transferase superfamily protein [Cytophagales bacterium]|nr:MAG: 4'-phosphopantetheinyl transferase superfamily protein [Cytophagales bacterium]TAF61141.1 MAG: 4'-phosphopantetheinyl transferase superfamily protein [Cytophagales bacterium]
MPYALLKETTSYLLAGWTIQETPEELTSRLPEHLLETFLQDVTLKPAYVLQKLAVRCLLLEMAAHWHIPYEGIQKGVWGEPLWSADPKLFLSYSHTQNFVAAILHTQKAVGIDIEAVSGRALRVFSRFAAPSEKEFLENELDATMLWCAKEAMYKWYRKRKLTFAKDILLSKKEGAFCGTVLGSHAVEVDSLLLNGYWVVWCM